MRPIAEALTEYKKKLEEKQQNAKQAAVLAQGRAEHAKEMATRAAKDLFQHEFNLDFEGILFRLEEIKTIVNQTDKRAYIIRLTTEYESYLPERVCMCCQNFIYNIATGEIYLSTLPLLREAKDLSRLQWVTQEDSNCRFNSIMAVLLYLVEGDKREAVFTQEVKTDV